MKMNRMLVGGVAMVAVLASTGAAFAAPVAVKVPIHAIYAKPHLVTVTLRNDSATPMTLLAGSTEIVLAPGKPTPMKFAVGEKLTVKDASATYVAGTLVAVISKDLDQATMSFK